MQKGVDRDLRRTPARRWPTRCTRASSSSAARSRRWATTPSSRSPPPTTTPMLADACRDLRCHAGRRRFRKIVAGRKLWNFEHARARDLAARAVTDATTPDRDLRAAARSTRRRSSRRSRTRRSSGRYRIRGFGTLRAAAAAVPRRPDVPAGLLTRIPLEGYRERCETTTVLGHRYAERPIELEIPVMITGMSYGALSFNAKVALARGAPARSARSTTIGRRRHAAGRARELARR